MKKYQIKNTIGSGNFSTVYRAQDPQTYETYAVKIMKTHPKIAVREAHFLNKMKHPNVIELLQFQQNQEESKLLFEHVGINTLQLYESHSYGLREEQVKCILFQTALGLAYIHSFGIIHRDIKPQNLLIDKKNALVKIIDFGLAISQQKISTDYIATRWYRAPENLLATKQYTTAIDVFSLGCVIVELYLGSPLFPGSNNMDQLYKIFNILGEPSIVNWPLGYKKMVELGVKGNTKSQIEIDLKSILNPCDVKLIQLIQKMLILNPKQRITCEKIVKHEYFKDIKNIIPPLVYKRYEEDFLKPSVDPLSFKGFHQIKNSKLSIKQTVKSIGSSKNKYSAHRFRSLDKMSRKEKNESLDSFHSSQNKKAIQPSIIKSVQPIHADSSKYTPRSRFLTNASTHLETPLTISNNKLNFDYKSKIIKSNSFINKSIESKEPYKIKETQYSKNSTEDTAGQRSKNFLGRLEKVHEKTQLKMKKLNTVIEKEGNEKKINTSNKGATYGLRTDRSPEYIEQIKNVQAPKMVRVPENKNSSPIYRGNISPSNKFNYKIGENTRKNDESYRYGSPKNVYINSQIKKQKMSPMLRSSDEGRKIDMNPHYPQQNKIQTRNYQGGKVLNHYRSYDNLSNGIGYPQRNLRKSPQITAKNYPTNFNKYNRH